MGGSGANEASGALTGAGAAAKEQVPRGRVQKRPPSAATAPCRREIPLGVAGVQPAGGYKKKPTSAAAAPLGARYPWGSRALSPRGDIKKADSMSAFCASLGIRTLDPLIKSQLLYQLS